MKITYLHHSGFALEYDTFVILFDAITPPKLNFKDRRVYFFASHSHADHYSKDIFTYSDNNKTTYILSDDIRDYKKAENVILVNEYREYTVKDFTFKTFGSTDIGVSFYVKTDDYGIFHSGDLNWWHWDEDSDENNLQMEKDYKRHIKNLSEYKVNIAFIPADPRLDYAFDYSVKYFIDAIKPDILAPMHFWDEYDIPKKLMQNYASSGTKILDIPNKNKVIYDDKEFFK